MKKILCIILFICISGFWIVLLQNHHPFKAIDSSDTNAYLEQLANQDQQQIQDKIDNIEQALQKDQQKSLPQRFQNSVIVGDSMVHALMDYQALPNKNLAGAIGRRTDNVFDQVDIALKRKPQYIFLNLGVNDMSTYRDRFALFEEKYQKVIDYIQKKDKNVEIYINSLIPLPKSTLKEYKEYKYIDDYNKTMEKLCEDNHIGYVDNTKLLKPELKYFESDGIHPKYPYFPTWLQNMADTANLK